MAVTPITPVHGIDYYSGKKREAIRLAGITVVYRVKETRFSTLYRELGQPEAEPCWFDYDDYTFNLLGMPFEIVDYGELPGFIHDKVVDYLEDPSIAGLRYELGPEIKREIMTRVLRADWPRSGARGSHYWETVKDYLWKRSVESQGDPVVLRIEDLPQP